MHRYIPYVLHICCTKLDVLARAHTDEVLVSQVHLRFPYKEGRLCQVGEWGHSMIANKVQKQVEIVMLMLGSIQKQYQ